MTCHNGGVMNERYILLTVLAVAAVLPGQGNANDGRVTLPYLESFSAVVRRAKFGPADARGGSILAALADIPVRDSDEEAARFWSEILIS